MTLKLGTYKWKLGKYLGQSQKKWIVTWKTDNKTT